MSTYWAIDMRERKVQSINSIIRKEQQEQRPCGYVFRNNVISIGDV